MAGREGERRARRDGKGDPAHAKIRVPGPFVLRGQGSGRDSVVFVEWTFRGTFEGRADVARGVTLFEFDCAEEEEEEDDEKGPPSSRRPPRIARSSVYRQALPAEVDLARRTKGEVAEGALLERKEAGE